MDINQQDKVYKVYSFYRHSSHEQVKQGSYRQVCLKFKDFSRTSKRLSYCFQGLKTYEILIYTLKFYFGNA